MQPANFFLPAERLHYRPMTGEQSSRGAAQPSRANVRGEIEHRLWKVCREAASPKLGLVELTFFLCLGAVAIPATGCAIYEIFDLLRIGGLDQTVRMMMN